MKSIYKMTFHKKNMSQATYRGIPYDTDSIKKEYENWYSATHAPSSPKNKYRGILYRPCNNWDWEKTKK